MKDCAVQVHDHVTIALPDGLRLSARIWQPQTDQPLPAILEVHPYPHAYATATRDEINHGWFARNGYVAIRVDTPGSGDSEGHMSDQYQPEELDSILAILDWIKVQDWCDGNIGMFGHSWGAYSSLQIAAKQPEGLRAIAFSGASDNLYTEDCHYRGGVLASENMGWASTLLSFLSRPPTVAGFGSDRTEKWINRLEQLEWVLPKWLNHAARDSYWHQGSICDDYSRVQIPVLAASGWADTYATAIMRMAENMPGPFAGVIGPWAHKFPHMGMPKPAIGWLQEVTAWWDHWLKGIDTGAHTKPRLRAFLSENIAPETQSDSAREGRWVAESVWPSPTILPRAFKLSRGHLGATSSGETIQIASPPDLGTAGGELMPMAWGADLPGDQRGDDGRSVTFDSEVLGDAVDVLGRISLELTLTSDKPVSFVVARICDVHPNGTSTRVAFGAQNLTHSPDHSTVTPLTPGVTHAVRFELDATGYRFLPGHRIRLSLSNACWPLLWPSPEVTTLTMGCANARLILPLRPIVQEPAVTFAPVGGANARARAQVSPSSAERTVTTDIMSAKTTYRVLDISTHEQDVSSGIENWGTTERIYEVGHDPADALMTSSREVNLLDQGQHLKTVTKARMTSDKTHFHTEVTLSAWRDGDLLLERAWKEKIRRNGC